MSWRRTAAVASAVAAVAVAGASATSASAMMPLTLTEGSRTLSAGETFYMYGGQAYVDTSDGTLECEENPRMEAELTPEGNAKPTDELNIDDLHGGYFGPCRSYTGNADPSVSLGGTLSLHGNGRTKGTSVGLEITYEHVLYKEEWEYGVECVYSHKLVASNTATATPEPLGLSFEQTMSLDRMASSPEAKHLCPSSATLSLDFPTFESEYGTIDEHTGRT
jgi:hypothetical protein